VKQKPVSPKTLSEATSVTPLRSAPRTEIPLPRSTPARNSISLVLSLETAIEALVRAGLRRPGVRSITQYGGIVLSPDDGDEFVIRIVEINQKASAYQITAALTYALCVSSLWLDVDLENHVDPGEFLNRTVTVVTVPNLDRKTQNELTSELNFLKPSLTEHNWVVAKPKEIVRANLPGFLRTKETSRKPIEDQIHAGGDIGETKPDN